MLNFGSAEALAWRLRAAGYIGRGAVLCWPEGYFHAQAPFVALGIAAAQAEAAGIGSWAQVAELEAAELRAGPVVAPGQLPAAFAAPLF